MTREDLLDVLDRIPEGSVVEIQSIGDGPAEVQAALFSHWTQNDTVGLLLIGRCR